MKKNNLKKAVFIIGFFTVNLAHGEIYLPSIISHNMVLQQNDEVTIWGWTTESAEEIVVWGNGARILLLHKPILVDGI